MLNFVNFQNVCTVFMEFLLNPSVVKLTGMSAYLVMQTNSQPVCFWFQIAFGSKENW